MCKVGVVAFAFGTPAALHSNRLIAWLAANEAQKENAPIFTQADIQFGEGYQGLNVRYVAETAGDPPPTLRIARAAIAWAIGRELDELVISAAGPHLWRCMRDMRKAADEFGWRGGIRSSSKIATYGDDDWFRPESTQERTQSKKNWRKRERIVELMPFAIYKHVAS